MTEIQIAGYLQGYLPKTAAPRREELVKVASLIESIKEIEWGKVPDKLPPSIQTARRSARRRFAKIHKTLRTQGVDVVEPNDIIRLSVSKGKLTKDDLKLLGFEPVVIAVPESGQKTFESYRHPSSNHHIHDHGHEWVIHEDEHASTTMLWRKATLQREGKSIQAPHRLKKRKSTRDKPLSKIKAALQGMKHIVTEGFPGMYGYIRGQVKGVPSMSDRLDEALPKSMRRRFNKWVPSKTVAPDWVPHTQAAPRSPEKKQNTGKTAAEETPESRAEGVDKADAEDMDEALKWWRKAGLSKRHINDLYRGYTEPGYVTP
jgi:hypothetical protein